MSDIPKTLRFLIHIQKFDNILNIPHGHHSQWNSNAKQARKRVKGTRTLTLATEWANRCCHGVLHACSYIMWPTTRQ